MIKPKIEYTITASKGMMDIDFPEIWRYRELLYIFAWRDIKVRYKQTFLGIAWAIFQPFVTMIVFSVVFGRLASVPSEGIPYPIFVYSGLLFWNFFSATLTNTSDCLISNEGIIKKIYFPRLILPIATAVTPMIDFCFAFLVIVGLLIYYHYSPSILGLVLLPLLLLLTWLAASGIGFFLASVNAKFRDVRYILPYIIQAMMFITPIIYPPSIVPQKFQWIIWLNPMAGIITLDRALLLRVGSINWHQVEVAVGISLILLIFGVIYFRKTERFFADIL